MGIDGDGQIDGRVLKEALSKGPDEEKVPVETVTYSTALPGGYKAYLQVSYVNGKRYIDKSWLDKTGQ